MADNAGLHHRPVAMHRSPPLFTQREFRDALGTFATGVTVVTALAEDGRPIGLTANSFNSVSLHPPLVLWSLSCSASSMDVFAQATHYAINVLAADQVALARQFATKGIDRWAGVAHHGGQTGVPLLDGALATFECRSHSRHPEGDHVVFVGEVLHCQRLRQAPPLLYHGGQFYTEHPL
jgi:flavin reductase (DIM6/NTAB) family NADH-FMN oxidoreductase RutF